MHFLWSGVVLITGGDEFRVEFRTFRHVVECRLITLVHKRNQERIDALRLVQVEMGQGVLA